MERDLSTTFLGSLAAWHHPAKNAKARVLLVHGLSEHSARHLNTINYLSGHGIDCVRFDLRGAGKSGGRRQWIEQFDNYVSDTVTVYNWISRDMDPLPLFVLGHSLGGAIATYFTVSHQKSLRGLMLSSPACSTGSAIPPLKVAAARLLSRFAPRLKLKNIRGNSLSKDPSIYEAYQQDPLSFHYTRLHQGVEILRAMEQMNAQAKRLQLPVLIVHGTNDRIVRLEGSYQFLMKLGSGDRSLQIMPNVYHEPHNDLEKEEYFQSLLGWMQNRL